MRLRQPPDETVLGGIRVLVFVHHHVSHALRHSLPDLRLPIEQCERLPDQIIEVHRVARPELLLIGAVYPRCEIVLEPLPARGKALRIEAAVLGVADAAPEQPGRKRPIVDLEGCQDFLDERFLVGIVVNEEIGSVPEMAGVAPQQPQAP